MKPVLMLTLALSMMLTACEKQNESDDENTDLRTIGFICTIGINSIGEEDTIALRTSVSGNFDVTDYTANAESRGFIVRPRDIWQLIITGDNNWHLKNSAGKYISFEDNPYASNNEYSYDLDDVPTEKSVFIRTKGDGQNFYLESKYKRGYYLITRGWDVYPPDPSHMTISFQPKKQFWFFMP